RPQPRPPAVRRAQRPGHRPLLRARRGRHRTRRDARAALAPGRSDPARPGRAGALAARRLAGCQRVTTDRRSHAVTADAGRGRAVTVSGRGGASAEPARLSIDGGRWTDVVAWAGPWPTDERWWGSTPSEPKRSGGETRGGDARRRRARWQVVTADGTAHLLCLEDG